MFSQKTILITGGTGTIGRFVVQKLIHTSCKKIIIYSRDEDKQFFMQQQYEDKRLEYVIGDVRDAQRLENVLCDVDYVVHAAAIKHVSFSEKNPIEAVLTNIIGTNNVIQCSERKNVKKVVCLSTDKAISPSNCMGMTKGIGERLIRNAGKFSKKTDVVCVRLGNVLGSRGSVIPLWKKQIEQMRKITLTDYRMTRFIMTCEDVFQLLKHAFDFGLNGEIIIPQMKACSIFDLAKVVCQHYGLDEKTDIILTEAKAGEKLYEELIGADEFSHIYIKEGYYHIGHTTQNKDICIPYRSDNCSHSALQELDKILHENQLY